MARERSVSVRLSDAQYAEIQEACRQRGGLSMSDVIRDRAFRDVPTELRLRALEARVSAAEARLNLGWVAHCEIPMDTAPLLMLQKEGA